MKAPLDENIDFTRKYYRSAFRRRNAIIINTCTILISIVFLVYINLKSELFTLIFLSLIIFGAYSLFRQFLNKPSVIISAKGIYTFSNFCGWIEWKYIERIEIDRGMNMELIVIKINDIDGFLKPKNFIAKTLMKTNIKKFGTPALIPMSEIDVEFSEFKNDALEIKNKVLVNNDISTLEPSNY
ncbi:MAG: hypothetical protein K2X86_01460 [Cytophagaceae bacterium]|nr:hypothetical protein [Cytophagaceae bacterium]